MSHQFQVGQIVVRYSSFGHSRSLCVVTKVWKNGVTEVGQYGKDAVGGREQFNPDGHARGSGGSWRRARIEPLPDGMTPEKFLAKQKTESDKRRAEEDKKAAERQQRIDTWWKETGEKIWMHGTTMPPFMGEEVHCINWTEHGEEKMGFVVSKKVKRWDDQEEYELTCSGLVGRQYNNSKEEQVTSISSFATSTCNGKTFPEALYNLCN